MPTVKRTSCCSEKRTKLRKNITIFGLLLCEPALRCVQTIEEQGTAARTTALYRLTGNIAMPRELSRCDEAAW
jgi:hypothetical protein